MNHNSGQEVFGGMLLFVLAFFLLRGCADTNFQDRYNYCMNGSSGKGSIFKAVFVCIWS